MQRAGLSVLIPAALWAVSVLPATAQVMKAKAAPPPTASSLNAEVVGSVDDKGSFTNFTFGELITRFQKDSPQQFNQAVESIVAPKAVNTLFGPGAKGSVTLTQTDVLAGLREKPTRPLADMLNTMIQVDCVNRQAAKLHVVVTEAQVENKVNLLLKKLRDAGNIPAGQTDDQFLAEQHVPRSQLLTSFRPQVQISGLIVKELETRIGHPIGPNDFVKCRHILIKVNSPIGSTKPEDKKADADALAKATALAADIRAGKITFEKAAQDNTDDTGSKATGGEMGVASRGIFVKEFENAAFSQKVHEVGPPIRSQFGYHIIQVEQAGGEIPQSDRDAYLDKYTSDRLAFYLNTLTTTSYKITNKLAALAPQPQMPVMRGQQ